MPDILDAVVDKMVTLVQVIVETIVCSSRVIDDEIKEIPLFPETSWSYIPIAALFVLRGLCRPQLAKQDAWFVPVVAVAGIAHQPHLLYHRSTSLRDAAV